MSTLVIGIDAGGTKTALLGRSSGRDVHRTAPGLHLLRDGTEATADALAGLIRDASDGARCVGVCVGIAGAGRLDDQHGLEKALGSRLADTPIRAVHDAEIALHAAWKNESGAVLIVGTGSVLFARDEEGAIHRAGGWGWRAGDDGSGTALGQAALRIALAVHDGGPPSTVSEALAEEGLDSGDAIRHAVYNEERPVASFAPVLLSAVETGDWQAEQALFREANAVGQQAGWLATRLGDRITHRLALTGGLAGNETYRTRLTDSLARHLPGWDISVCDCRPVEGALALAETLVP